MEPCEAALASRAKGVKTFAVMLPNGDSKLDSLSLTGSADTMPEVQARAAAANALSTLRRVILIGFMDTAC
jgi:hypothetical protein